YDDPPEPGELSNSGLVFVTFQADIEAQFTPIQRRLAELDSLNDWTTPIGSAVFAVPRGCRPGEYLGQPLLEA
ncbi:MAG: peroxidase, partial [Saccharomonospora viridis]